MTEISLNENKIFVQKGPGHPLRRKKASKSRSRESS